MMFIPSSVTYTIMYVLSCCWAVINTTSSALSNGGSSGEIDFLAPCFYYGTQEKIMQKNFKLIAMKISRHSVIKIISNIKMHPSNAQAHYPLLCIVDISPLNEKIKIGDLDDL